MRIPGLLLVAVGFLAAAFVAVLDPEQIDLLWFGISAGVAAVGVTLARIAAHRAARDTSRIEANFQTLDTSLARIVEQIGKLDDEKDGIDVYDLPGRIDEVLMDDLQAFADARESITHVWGSKAYADIMSPFAAGERYLNRVWSCAADGWIDEAHDYLGRARAQLGDALEQLEGLRSKG